MIRWLLAVLNLAVSVAVPLWFEARRPTTLSDGEALLFGILLFIALTTFEIYVLAEGAFAKELRLIKIWDAREKLDQRLQEVRRLFHQIEEEKVGEPDFFVKYFTRQLANLEAALRDASSRREVRIDQTMFEVTTWLYESSFHGREGDIFYAVHLAADNDFFFDVHPRRYFRQAFEFVQKGALKGVRRLIVYADKRELEDKRTQKLVAFHYRTEGYDYRLLPDSVFNQIMRDYALDLLIRDFGVYGSAHLYKALVNRPEEIVGSYSRDKDEIARFTDCFEACWQAGERPLPKDGRDAGPSLTLEWLFDPNSDGPEAGVTS